MKKLFLALLAAAALSFALSSCGESEKPTPVDSLMEQMIGVVDFANQIKEVPEMQTTDNVAIMMDKMMELKNYAKENADYELTDADRAKLKTFMKESGDKLGIHPSDEELEEVNNYKTLQDLIDVMGL